MSAEDRPESDGAVTVIALASGILTLLSPFLSSVSDLGILERILPFAVSGMFLIFLGAVVGIYRRRSQNPRTFYVAAAGTIALAVIVVDSWVGFEPAGSDPGPTSLDVPTTAGESTPTGTPTATAPAAPTLCAESPAAVGESWLLYETAGAEDKIVVEKDGELLSISGSAFSAASRRVVYADVADPSRVEVRDIVTEELVASKAVHGRVTDTTISRDGDTVVLLADVGGDTRFVLWRPSTDELDEVYNPRADLAAPSLAPAGDRLAWVQGAGSTGEVRVADLATLDAATVSEVGSDPAWFPDGSGIVYSEPFGEGWAIYASSLETGDSRRLTAPVGAADSDAVVTPSCDGVVYARAEDGSVDLWQTLDGADDERLKTLAGAQGRPAFAYRH